MAKQWWLHDDDEGHTSHIPKRDYDPGTPKDSAQNRNEDSSSEYSDENSSEYSADDSSEYTSVDSEVRKPRRPIRTWQWVALGLVLIVAGGIAYLWIQVAKGMPTLAQLENPHPELATRLISADGEPLDQYYIKNRTSIHLRNVPPHLIQALLATEDRDFYNHWGVNLWGNIRAAWTDLVTLSPRQGASTITQQLARNLYLTQEKSMVRKLREMASAVKIERTHTKQEILEMYLNVAYFGRGAYGIEAASQVYFGKDVNQLNIAESAYLVGILKGPENYDPEENYERAMARRNTVFLNMADAKVLTREQAQSYMLTPIRVQAMKGYQGIAPHFVEMIRQELSRKPEMQGYDLYRDGLVVYTTLNATMQRAANAAVEEHVSRYQRDIVDKRWNWNSHKGLLDTIVTKAIRMYPEYRTADNNGERSAIEKRLRSDKKFVDSVKNAEIRMQVGFVCLDQSTGQILAMVGSSNFRQARYGLNHVTQITRQPGSAFKPIIYSACFENGSTPESIVSNGPVAIPDGDKIWAPGNFEGEAVGGVRTIRSALQYSVNLCAIHAMLELTSMRDVIRMAKRLGIRSNIPAYPSIALGTAEVNPLELTSAYSTFANEGVRATPYAVLRVEDRAGKILYKAKPEFENVLEPRIAHMMTSALEDVVNAGTAIRIRGLGFHYPAAGKTGTTQNFADAWFMGYTPHFTAGVWVGFDDKRVSFTGADGQGGRAAAPIWGLFMKRVYDELRPKVQYFVTSYSNTAAPGEGPIHLSVPDTTMPEIRTTLPSDQKPSILPPAPQPSTPIQTIGDNGDEDEPGIGGSQVQPPVDGSTPTDGKKSKHPPVVIIGPEAPSPNVGAPPAATVDPQNPNGQSPTTKAPNSGTNAPTASDGKPAKKKTEPKSDGNQQVPGPVIIDNAAGGKQQ
jgi:penicillin-binding protein 1A